MRRLAGALALLLTITGVFPVHCFGWQNSAEQRMDCCRKAGHECPDQRAADACCQSGEQRDEQSVPGVTFVAASPLPRIETIDFARPVETLAESAVRWFRLILDARPSRPSYALTSVLLI
jgi:hypothetical protein